jgi:hypothetical protein
VDFGGRLQRNPTITSARPRDHASSTAPPDAPPQLRIRDCS